MKVRCRQLINELEPRRVITQSQWLTVGKIYFVLEISQTVGKPMLFRLLSDNGVTPALFDVEQFEILTNVIPRNWVVSMEGSKYFSLLPKAWDSPDFWVSFFDKDPQAEKIFWDEYHKVISEESSGEK